MAPLSALAPFATDDISRRQPWAVTDNAGMLWLFWLELVGQQWQLRYNRYDGTNWTLAVPATFPLDAGADPRVEGPPFVVFHPTDAAQRLWVFWARTEPIGASGQRRWRIVYRVKASLNPSARGLECDPCPAARASRVTRSRAGSAGQSQWRCRTLLEFHSQRQLVDLAGNGQPRHASLGARGNADQSVPTRSVIPCRFPSPPGRCSSIMPTKA